MIKHTIAFTALALAALSGCASSGGQPTNCMGATYECTTQQRRYDVAHKRVETTEKHWGCSSWSGSSCTTWLDADNPHNRTIIDSSKGLREMQQSNSSSSFGGSSNTSFGSSSSSSSSGGSSFNSAAWFKKHGAMSP
jgi:hypothetical protein